MTQKHPHDPVSYFGEARPLHDPFGRLAYPAEFQDPTLVQASTSAGSEDPYAEQRAEGMVARVCAT